MEHNTQHNIISDSMIDAAENIRKVEIADAKAIVDIYNLLRREYRNFV